MSVRSVLRTTWDVVSTWSLVVGAWAGLGALGCLVASAVFGWVWWVGLVLPVVALVGGEAVSRMAHGSSASLGTVVDERDEPRLHALLDRLCALSGQGKPEVCVMEVNSPNSLLHAPRGERPVLCVTRGLLDRLDDPQLEAVLAHELAHLAHHDTRVMNFASAVAQWPLLVPAAAFMGIGALDVGVCVLAGRLGQVWKPAFDTRGWRELRTNPPEPWVSPRVGRALRVLLGLARAVLMLTALFVAFPLIMLGLVVLPFGMFVVARLTRRRELAADRAAAMTTGAPATLAAALTRIGGKGRNIPRTDLRELGGSAALAIVAGTAPPKTDNPVLQAVNWLLRSHPSTSRRVARLERMSRRMGRAGR